MPQQSCENLTEQDSVHLRRAIELSELAATPEYGGNHPFGGVLVLGDGRVVEGWNHSSSENDPGQHAERWLISHAIQSLKLDWAGADKPLLSGASLYTSTEPCAMCAGAVYWSGIGRVVFGCSLPRFYQVIRKAFPGATDVGLTIPAREVLASSARPTVVVGPCLEQEAVAIHERYWPGGLSL